MPNFDAAAATAAYLNTIPPEQLEKATAYTQGSHWLVLWGLLVSLAASWIIVRSNLLVAVRNKKRRRWLTCVLVSGLFLAMHFGLSLPWSIYEGWYREKVYGLNNQTLANWLGDALKSAAVSLVFGTVFLTLFYALVHRAKCAWWLWTSGLAVALMVLGIVVMPIFIEPLFNTYTPAPNGPVRAAVLELAHKTGTPDDKVYIYDGTRQSDRYTANVAGLFGSARIALSDAMFRKNADIAEIRAVVAHEMGHYVRKHVLWSTAVHASLAVMAFWLVHQSFSFSKRLLGAAQVQGIDDPAGVPVLVAMLSVLSVLTTPLAATLSRLAEMDADRFSLRYANEPDGMARALLKTVDYRAPSPSAIEEFLFYSHPSIERRIHGAMEWKARSVRRSTTVSATQAR